VDTLLQWAIDLIEAWQTLPPILHVTVVSALTAAGSLFVGMEWKAALGQQGQLHEARIRDAIL